MTDYAQGVASGKRDGSGLFRRDCFVPLHSTGNPFQLCEPEIFEQTRLGIEGPIQRADAALAVARVDPVDQFLIAELGDVALAVVDVAAIDLAMPQDAVLREQAAGCQPLEILLAPRIAARVIIDSWANAGLFVGTVAEGDDGFGNWGLVLIE